MISLPHFAGDLLHVRTDRRAGFTMLDIVLTVMVLGFVSAIAVPRMSNAVNRTRADHAALLLASELEQVRQKATAQSLRLNIQFANSPARFTVTEVGSTTVLQTYELTDLIPGGTLQANFQNQASLMINQDGRPARAGTVQISYGGNTRVVATDTSQHWRFYVQ